MVLFKCERFDGTTLQGTFLHQYCWGISTEHLFWGVRICGFMEKIIWGRSRSENLCLLFFFIFPLPFCCLFSSSSSSPFSPFQLFLFPILPLFFSSSAFPHAFLLFLHLLLPFLLVPCIPQPHWFSQSPLNISDIVHFQEKANIWHF